MARYDYRCDHCGTSAEVQKPIAESEVVEICIGCWGSMTKVHLQPTLVTYKGDWFKTTGKY